MKLLCDLIQYFKRANASFAAAALNAGELSTELARGATWHWVRVVIGVVAFGAALLGLTTPQL